MFPPLCPSLYDDAERSGLQGIKQARELWRQSKEFASVANDIPKLDGV